MSSLPWSVNPGVRNCVVHSPLFLVPAFARSLTAVNYNVPAFCASFLLSRFSSLLLVGNTESAFCVPAPFFGASDMYSGCHLHSSRISGGFCDDFPGLLYREFATVFSPGLYCSILVRFYSILRRSNTCRAATLHWKLKTAVVRITTSIKSWPTCCAKKAGAHTLCNMLP